MTVNTTGGLPTLTLSNGAIATYDAAASSASGHILVFDYTVGANDAPTDLAISHVNPNGATFADANGHSVNFSRILNQPTQLEINPATVTVVSSTTGEVDSGQVQLTLTASQALTVNTSGGLPTLTLNDGATATFDHASGDQLVFDYTVGSNDHRPNLQVTSVNLNGATIADAHALTPDFSGALNVNTGTQIGPTFYVSALDFDPPGGGEVDAGQSVEFFLTMSKAATISGGSPSLTLSNGATATYDAARSNLTSGVIAFDYTVGSSDHSPDLEISGVNNGSTIEDAGLDTPNFNPALNKPTSVQIGSSPLTVTSVAATPSGQATNNELVTITLTLNEAATVTGIPVLYLNDYEQATYDSGLSNPSGKTLVFTYNVDTVDYATGNLEITGLVENGTAIQDANGYNLDLTAAESPLGIGVGTTLTPLVVQSITTNAPSSEMIAGQTLQITLNMTEGVTLNTSGGSPTLTLDDGATATYDAAASNLASGKLVFDYVIGAGDHDASLWIRSANLNGATIKDSNQHAADLSDAAFALIGVQIGPAGVIGVSTSQIGDYQSGQTVQLELTMGDPVTVNTSGGSPTVSLNDGGIASYDVSSSSPGTGILVFDYAISSGQKTSDLMITGVNSGGANITDPAGSSPDFSLALNSPTYLAIGAPEIIVSSGEVLTISSGQTSNGLSIESGGKLIVSKGGTAYDLTVSSGGALNVAGTITSDVTVFAGGVETVSSGGVVTGASGSDTAISGTVNVLSGGSLEHATILAGGKLNLAKGGTVDHLNVSSGGTLNVAGKVTSDVAVFAGGVETVSSGGVVSGLAGSGTAISGGTVNVLSGGAFTFADVDSGGHLNVSKGGIAHDITVSSGGQLNVAGTITSNVVVVSGGVETVSSGGLVSGNDVGAGTEVSGGTVNVLLGGTYGFSLLSDGGTLNVSKGGTAHEIFISSGGELNVAGTVTGNVVVFSGGVETVSSGGVFAGATVSRTIISGGEVDVLSGGKLDFASVFSGGVLNVSGGGSAANVVVSLDGNLNVAGTTTSNVTILSGGTETISSGGVASGVAGSGTSVAGGTLDVQSGGTVAFASVSSNGVLDLSAGAVAHDIAVSSGAGEFEVYGSTTSNITISSGGIEVVYSGGVALAGTKDP